MRRDLILAGGRRGLSKRTSNVWESEDMSLSCAGAKRMSGSVSEIKLLLGLCLWRRQADAGGMQRASPNEGAPRWAQQVSALPS